MTENAVKTSFAMPWHLISNPVRFFRSRLERQPRYVLALLPLAVYTVLVSAAVLIGARKTRFMTEAALADAKLSQMGPAWIGDVIGAVSSVTTVGFMFTLSALAVVTLDTLVAQSGRGRRLVEFTALSYWSQLPLAAAWLGIVTWWWYPPPLQLSPDVTSAALASALSDYQEEIAGTTVLSTLQLAGSYFWCWFVALQATALRVVSGFSVGGAWAAGILLAILFVGLPYAVQQLW